MAAEPKISLFGLCGLGACIRTAGMIVLWALSYRDLRACGGRFGDFVGDSHWDSHYSTIRSQVLEQFGPVVNLAPTSPVPLAFRGDQQGTLNFLWDGHPLV
jgi:hypothetical protein